MAGKKLVIGHPNSAMTIWCEEFVINSAKDGRSIEIKCKKDKEVVANLSFYRQPETVYELKGVSLEFHKYHVTIKPVNI